MNATRDSPKTGSASDPAVVITGSDAIAARRYKLPDSEGTDPYLLALDDRSIFTSENEWVGLTHTSDIASYTRLGRWEPSSAVLRVFKFTRIIITPDIETRHTGTVSRQTPSTPMHFSKRSLGEGYIVGTGVVLAIVLFGELLRSGAGARLWRLAWGAPVFVLVGAAFWLQRLDLTSDQVWTVAEFSALGLGIGTLLLVVVELITPGTTLSVTRSVLLGTTLSTMAVAGTFAGVVSSIHQSKRDLQRQNAVLHRVLRHNLRNDMTVVMCMLDDIDAATDQDHHERIDEAKEKIESLVRLTDKVRRASGPDAAPLDCAEPLDVAALVDERVSKLEETHANVDIETTLADQALAYIDESFGLVVDNVVESAVSKGTTTPELGIVVATEGTTVRLRIEDRSHTIPQADLAAVAAGSETALEHGLGVELWLVDWLVDANGGQVTFEPDGDVPSITVSVDRATNDWL